MNLIEIGLTNMSYEGRDTRFDIYTEIYKYLQNIIKRKLTIDRKTIKQAIMVMFHGGGR